MAATGTAVTVDVDAASKADQRALLAKLTLNMNHRGAPQSAIEPPHRAAGLGRLFLFFGFHERSGVGDNLESVGLFRSKIMQYAIFNT